MVIGMIKTIRFILVILFWVSILRLNCLNGRRGFVGVAYTLCYSEGSGQYKVLRSVIRKFRGRPEVSEL